MEIDIGHQTCFKTGEILVRGRIAHGDGERQLCAVVTLPAFFGGRDMTDDEARDFARPLLVKEFAAGHWHWLPSKDDECHVVNGEWVKAREPILIEG